MKPCLEPTDELISRALVLNFKKKKHFWLHSSNQVGLLRGLPWGSIKYVGTVTFKRHKVRENVVYTFLKSYYNGKLIKMGFRILGKKRVRIYFRKGNDNEKILLLGTKEGTIALACMYKPENDYQEIVPLFKVSKSPSPILVRRVVYVSI